jgi:hypothetical protein
MIQMPMPFKCSMICLQRAALILFVLMGIAGAYLAWFDRDPIVTYGSGSYVERQQNRLIVHIDAVRQRDCQAVIYYDVTGCGDIFLPPTVVTTPVGQRIPPVSIPSNDMSKSQLNICKLKSVTEGFCNPIQEFLGILIRSKSRSILFGQPDQDVIDDMQGF